MIVSRLRSLVRHAASPVDGAAYEKVATSDVAERYRNALFWIVEHLPQNWEALKHADAGVGYANPEQLRAILEAGVDAYERRSGLQ
jgi:hypothetical protein